MTLKSGVLRRAVLASCIAYACGSPAFAEDWFNPALLGSGGASVRTKGNTAPDTGVDDAILQRLANGQQPPGNYIVDVYVNDNSVGRRSVMLTADVRLLLPYPTP